PPPRRIFSDPSGPARFRPADGYRTARRGRPRHLGRRRHRVSPRKRPENPADPRPLDRHRHGQRHLPPRLAARRLRPDPHGASPRGHVLEVESDRLVNASIARRDLDAEMTVVRNEFESGENSPFGVLRERMAASAYLWHNYGKAIIGARSDIENVPIERLRAFYRHFYQQDNEVLVISGKLEKTASSRLAPGQVRRVAMHATERLMV